MNKVTPPRVVPASDLDAWWARRFLYPAAFVAVLVVSHCQAQAGTMGVHLYSPHFTDESDTPERLRMRDFTPGLYWRGDSGLTLGVVRNSFTRTSVYAAYTLERGRWSLTAGAITGYRYREVSGVDLCRKHGSKQSNPCTYVSGKTNAYLRPLLAPSVAFPEAQPYIGATPRVALLGKALSFSVEWSL